MKLDVTQNVTTLGGTPIKDQDENGNAVDATFGMAIVNALLSPVQNEKGIEKVHKYELARKVYESDTVELTVEDVALIKQRVLDVFPPLVSGQIVKVLER
jgi:hypothetical protein